MAERMMVGRVGVLWRYPVKSMLGEEVRSVQVKLTGVVGDRRLGVLDRETGLVASVKNPRRWRALLQARAELAGDDEVRVHLPDGGRVLSSAPSSDQVLSAYVGRPVTLIPEAAPGARLERVEADGPPTESSTVEFGRAAPAGTFFDFSALQFVTTASLEEAGSFHPAGKVDAVRYRPNIVIETTPELTGFVENDWVGRHVHLGRDVVLEVLIPSPRCVIPTVAHGDLPPDADSLRVLTRHNFVEIPIENYGSAPCLGAHAAVVQGGTMAVGDQVWLAD